MVLLSRLAEKLRLSWLDAVRTAAILAGATFLCLLLQQTGDAIS